MQQSIASFDSMGTTNHLQAAIHCLLRVEHADRYNNSLPPDSLIDNTIDYLQKTHSDYAATALFLKARLLYDKSENEEAMQLYLQAEKMAHNIPDLALLAYIYSDMGNIHYIQDTYTEARNKYERARYYYQQIEDVQKELSSQLKIIGTYSAEENYTVALQQVKNLMPQTLYNSKLWGMAVSEIADIYYKTKQYDSAAVYFQQALHTNIYTDYNCCQLASIHYKQQQYDSAQHYAKRVIRMESTANIHKACYGILANIADRQGDAVAQAHYLVKRDSCNNVLLAIEQQTPAHVLEQQMKDGEQINKLRQRSMAWGAVALVVLLIYLLYVRKMYKRMEEYKRMRKDMELAKKNIHKYKSQIQALEDSKETETEKNTEQIAQLNIQLENSIATQQQLIAQRRKIMRIATRAINEKIELCAAHLRKGEKYTHEQALRRAYEHEIHLYHAAKLKRWLNMEFNYLGKKLTHTHPSLTERDIQLFALILLQTPHKTVSSLLDILPGSVAKTQLRLAQRLNSETMDDLRDYAEVFVMGGA